MSIFSRTFAAFFISYISFFGLFAQAEEIVPVQIDFRIEGNETTYFNGKITTNECTIKDSNGKEHKFSHSIACALDDASKVAHFDYVFEDGSWGLYLKSIGTEANNWLLWTNNDPASVGLTGYTLQENDSILLVFSNVYPGTPLRVILPDKINQNQEFKIKVDKRTNVSTEEWGWEGLWEPAFNAKLYINNLTLNIPDSGELAVTLSDTKNTLWADGEDFIRSAKTIIDFAEPSPEPTASPLPSPSPSPTPSAEPTPEPTDLPTPSISAEQRSEKTKLAINFLKSKQDDDGSIEGSTSTIWSVIAFGANEDRAEKIKNGNKSLLDALADNNPESATDIERLIIAIRATGQYPHSFNGIDYVQQLKNKYKNNQFGEESFVNDDIFGVLAILSADESANSEILHNSVAALIKKQANNGLWENVDLTAAAIQMLREYKNSDGDINTDDTINKARTALKNSQDKFGGFGENSATTAWGIQAIVSLGENPSDWKISNGKDPWMALLLYQNTNGGFGWKNSDDPSPFMTAYAIPALLSSPWPISKLKIENNYKSSVVNTASQTPSTVLSPTPSAKPSAIPIVQKTTFKSSTKTSAGSIAGAETSSIPLSKIATKSTTTDIQTNRNPAKKNPKSLIFELGFTNIGIGMTIASAIRKIRLFV